MLTRRMVLAGAGLLALITAAGAQESWARYVNARFGTHVDYMEFFEPDPEPDNGDGRTFRSPEASFSVFAGNNVLEETPQSRLEEALASPDYAGLSYKAIRGDRLILSGRRGDRIFYEVYLFSASGLVHGLVLDYPAAEKHAYDGMVKRMAKSFGGP